MKIINVHVQNCNVPEGNCSNAILCFLLTKRVKMSKSAKYKLHLV